MTAIEIVLILVGIVFMIGSFFVTEKLSVRELEKIAELSEKEIKIIANRELSKASGQIEEQADSVVADSIGRIERSMDKQANEKIMEIGEYSDTVLENMNKTHNEIMFLYSMLNDKHTELTALAGNLTELSGEISSLETKVKTEIESVKAEDSAEEMSAQETMGEVSLIRAGEEKEPENEDMGNHNQRILELYKQGKSYVEIARELGLGLGEVKLVIELFRGEK